MLDLKNKHILVCGGSRGIGAATVKLAAKAGAQISINYRSNNSEAESLVEEVESTGGEAISIQGDISVEEDVTRIIDSAVARFGDLDGLVISAGIFEGGNLEEMSTEFWDRTMNINLKSNFMIMKAARSSLIANSGGSVVFIASTAGQRGSDVYSAYATSKGGQIIFMRSMARELAPFKIRCNCVAPGWTETDMATDTIDALGREDIVASIPLGRIGQPEDPGAATVFLLSDLAQFITGSTITVDGGFDMRG
ncbi:MAG: hypothetical protein COA79_02060 [Planctomycetota bacterium]|nr:MAG: hypothetical protein COA79_02060 [Planctomycetota bacterium]